MGENTSWETGLTMAEDVMGDFQIEVTYSDQKGLKHIFHVYGKNEDGDIIMDLLEEHKPNEAVKLYKMLDRRITVDERWFTHEPKRTIKKIDYPFI